MLDRALMSPDMPSLVVLARAAAAGRRAAGSIARLSMRALSFLMPVMALACASTSESPVPFSRPSVSFSISSAGEACPPATPSLA